MRFLAPILLLVLGGCAHDRTKTILGLDGDPEAGAEVYITNCAACHGEDGTGGIGPISPHRPWSPRTSWRSSSTAPRA